MNQFNIIYCPSLRRTFYFFSHNSTSRQCIRGKTGAQHIVKEIKQYQEMWLQHVQRMDINRLPKQALQYKSKGRRNIGRARKRWRDQLHLEDQGTGNTSKPSWTWWWWWWWWILHPTMLNLLIGLTSCSLTWPSVRNNLANSLTVSENDKTESPFEVWGSLRKCNFRAGESLERSLFTNGYQK